jgi:hypothetical protein
MKNLRKAKKGILFVIYYLLFEAAELEIAD